MESQLAMDRTYLSHILVIPNLKLLNTYFILDIPLESLIWNLISYLFLDAAKITIVAFISMHLNFPFRTYLWGKSSTRALVKLVAIQSMVIFSSTNPLPQCHSSQHSTPLLSQVLHHSSQPSIPLSSQVLQALKLHPPLGTLDLVIHTPKFYILCYIIFLYKL